jgi:ribose transport system ATP-binding protein
MELAGQPIVLGSPHEAAAQGIVIAHQHPSLAPDLPVWENLFLGAERTRFGGFIDRRRTRAEAGAVLDRLGARIDIDAPAGTLGASGQQMVEIARALSRRPRLLILDEPTAALAPAEVARLFGAVRRLTGDGVAVVFISHRLAEVEAICDRILVLRNGRHVGDWETSGRLDEARILDLMSGEPGRARQARARRAPGPPVLTVAGLRGGGNLRGVELELRAGEITGLSGLQGQGQEALLETLAGFRRPEAGSILYRGSRISARIPRDMIRRGICLVPNDRHREGLFLDQSVGENLASVRVALQRRPWLLPLAELRRFAERTIARLRVKTEGVEQNVTRLSGGNQQKIVIGKWLGANPDVLLLSDPTKGVDIHARAEIYATLDELAAAGSAILVYASDVQELLLHCDRILVMYEGRIAGNLIGGAMNEQQVMAASFGRAA